MANTKAKAKSVEKPVEARSVLQRIGDFSKSLLEKLKGDDEVTLSDGEQSKLYTDLESVRDGTQQVEGKAKSFFQEKIIPILRKFFPYHPFVSDLEQNGNAVDDLELLVNGSRAFPEIIKQIDDAKESIEITMFLWRDDKIGNLLLKHLRDAAKRGVKITIHKDRYAMIFEEGQGSQFSAFHHRTRGVMDTIRGSVFRTLYGDGSPAKDHAESNEFLDELQKVNEEHPGSVTIEDTVRKDHSKYYIFDNKTVITGGMNVGDEWAEDKLHDYMIKFTGPILVEQFKQRLRGHKPYEGTSIEFGINGPSAPYRQREIFTMHRDLIRNAKRKLTIEMAFFGDDSLTEEIENAAKRGVEVEVLVSEKLGVQDDLNRAVLGRLFEHTKDAKRMVTGSDGQRQAVSNQVKIYLISPTHAKLVHADGEKTFLGSANMNTTATRLLGETNVFVNCADCAFTEQIKQQLEDDKKAGKLVKQATDIPGYSLGMEATEALLAA